VEGNPVNLTDPSGLNPNCLFYHRDLCAFQRFDEILKENGSNGAKALVGLFTDSELQNVWGLYAGKTSAARLEWVLGITLGDAGSWKLDMGTKFPLFGIHLQFGILFPTSCLIDPTDENCGCGLASELEDSKFYVTVPEWGGQVSHQINHFLSGVGEYYYGRDLRTIIAHEKSTDANKFDNFFNEVTPQDYSHFYRAWHFDTNGMYTERDDELWTILGFNPKINFGDVDRNRRGNSLQDFRLSLRAVRFADWVMSNSSSDPSQAGDWLTSNLLP
jgi:hypothetical protein